MEQETTAVMAMLVSFPDQSEPFTLGFEAGQIWQEMSDEGKPIVDRGMTEGMPIHAANIELIRRMAAVRHYALETGAERDGWVPVRLTWTGSSRPALAIVRD